MNIFEDNPLAYDFLIRNNTSNENFALTNSSNIPPDAVGNLRAFLIDFCDFKYRYFEFPQIRELFSNGKLTATPINGIKPLVCPWEPTVVVTGGAGTGWNGVLGNFSVQEHDVATTGVTAVPFLVEPLLKGSYLYSVRLHAYCLTGDHVDSAAGLIRDVHVVSDGLLIKSIFINSTSTSRNNLPWSLQVVSNSNNIEFKVVGSENDTIQWKAVILKSLLMP